MFHHDKLDINQRAKEAIDILDLKGHLAMGGSDMALRDYVQALFDGGNRKLILNLGNISEIDTSGMGVLLLLAQEYSNAGGKLAIYNVQRMHGKVYEMARLETAVEIYRDEVDALNSFFPDRATPHYDILEYVESQAHPDSSEPEEAK